MSTGKKPAPKTGKAPNPHATYLTVKNGSKVGAYKAGQMHGVHGHRTFAHQPCLYAYTDGALPCPFCAGKVELQWRGYVPLFDQDWALRYVLIGEDYAESADVIPHRAQVMLLRAAPMKSPLVMREELTFTRALPDRSPWSREVDMELICLLLWKNEQLADWVRQKRAANVPEKQEEPKRANGKAFSPMLKGAARKYLAPSDAAPADDAYDAVAARLRVSAAKLKPSKNGKHDSSE